MRLTVETGPNAGATFPLDRDTPMLLGSAADCAVRIQEPGVLPQHAIVKALKGEGFGIKANGTIRVNGAEVQASRLRDGDVIEVGTTRIAYGDVQDDRMPTVAGYRILDVLGKGGMGTVYRAEQTSLHREVALKVLNTAQTKDAAFVSQFVAEARAAAKLQHPNVVSVFDVEHDGDLYYYAMELMHDGSCEDWLKQHGTMPADRATQVIADAAAGLAYAESLGIVHRDIKPDNLMLDQHGAIKIADLGLASTSSDPKEDRAVGTPHFMAPEQALKQPLDHRTDLYALGCTYYRLVTGRTPFRGQTVKDILRAQVKETPESASKVNPDVPQEVDAIIARLMAKDAGDRYQTANELLEELHALLQPQQKRGLWIGLAAVAVLVAGGAIYWAVTKPKEKEVVIEKYDDPLTQQFADRIKELEAEALQKDARIALLEVRASDAADAQLAAALEAVAAAHAGTAAASEADRLASQLRAEIDARSLATCASSRALRCSAARRSPPRSRPTTTCGRCARSQPRRPRTSPARPSWERRSRRCARPSSTRRAPGSAPSRPRPRRPAPAATRRRSPRRSPRCGPAWSRLPAGPRTSPTSSPRRAAKPTPATPRWRRWRPRGAPAPGTATRRCCARTAASAARSSGSTSPARARRWRRSRRTRRTSPLPCGPPPCSSSRSRPTRSLRRWPPAASTASSRSRWAARRCGSLGGTASAPSSTSRPPRGAPRRASSSRVS